MRRVGPFSLEGALLLLSVGIVILGVTTCNARRDGRREEQVRALESGIRTAKREASFARAQADSVMGIAQRAEAQIKSQVASNRKLSQRLSETLAANDSLLSAYRLNPDDSSATYTLSVALQRTTEVARLYRDSTEMLHNSVDVMIAAHVSERQAWLAERERNTILAATQDSVISALRGSKQVCRIVFVPCPSRVQSVAIGAGGMLLLLLL